MSLKLSIVIILLTKMHQEDFSVELEFFIKIFALDEVQHEPKRKILIWFNYLRWKIIEQISDNMNNALWWISERARVYPIFSVSKTLLYGRWSHVERKHSIDKIWNLQNQHDSYLIKDQNFSSLYDMPVLKSLNPRVNHDSVISAQVHRSYLIIQI